VAFDEEGDEGVEFVEGVENAEEVAWMTVGYDSEKIAQGWWYEST
jgi:sensor c-di-GMP phosphodiesterase-like protein